MLEKEPTLVRYPRIRLAFSTLVTGIAKSLGSRMFLPVILVVIALNIVWLYSNFSKVKNLNSPVLANGSRLPKIVGMDLASNRKIGVDSDSWRLVIYCSEESSFDIAKARYADLLMKKYHDLNFTAVGIVTEDCTQLKTMARQRDLSYPVILDESRTLASTLGLRDHAHGVFVADPEGVIQFAATAPHIEEEDLRQLVEKFVLGKVTYMDDASERAIGEGKLFPPLILEDLRTGETLSLNPQIQQTYNPYVVFTADCPACSLGTYLQSFQYLRKSLEAKGQRVMAIFSSRFSREQLLEEVRARQITTSLYLARGEMPGFEDAYYLRSFTSQVVVLTLDSRGIIERVQPIHEYLDMLKAQEAKK